MTPFEIVKAAQDLGLPEFDADLFQGFPLGSKAWIRVHALDATAWKRHVPGPRIPYALGAFDEQELRPRGGFTQHHRHRRLTLAVRVDQPRPVGRECAANTLERNHANEA